MSEKSGAEVVVEKLDSIESKSTEATEAVKELAGGIKEMGQSIKEAVESIAKKEEAEEVKSLKAMLSTAEEKLKLASSGQGHGGVSEEEELKSVQAIAQKLHAKEQIVEEKAIRFSDPTTTGNFENPSVLRGRIDVNKITVSPILGDIDVLPALPVNEGTVAWEGYDESALDLFDANEMDAAQQSKAIQESFIKLHMEEVKAKMIISSRVIQNAIAGGKSAAVLQRNLVGLDNKYSRKLAAKVFKDIIVAANAGKISKKSSTDNDAPVSDQSREDLRNFPSELKVDYLPASVMYVSRKFLNALFSKTADDGHLPLEQFVFDSATGIASFVTPEKAIPVRVFEHSQIGEYKSLADGTTAITADYEVGGDNTGKLLAFIGDLRFAYKLQPSSIVTRGYDGSITNILNGSVPAGLVSFAAQGVVAKEAIKVFYGK